MNSISNAATIQPFFLIKSFNEAVNGGENADFLSIAKKVLNVAFPIIALVNLLMVPFIMAYNCFFAKYDSGAAAAIRATRAQRATENEVLADKALNGPKAMFKEYEQEIEANEALDGVRTLFPPEAPARKLTPPNTP